MSANDIQFGGDHYKTIGLQHWDLMAKGDVPYLEGNGSKYGYRWPKKNGLEDVNKFGHYTQKIIELNQYHGYYNRGDLDMALWEQFCDENNVDKLSFEATSYLLDWKNVNDLYCALELIGEIRLSITD